MSEPVIDQINAIFVLGDKFIAEMELERRQISANYHGSYNGHTVWLISSDKQDQQQVRSWYKEYDGTDSPGQIIGISGKK